MERLVRQMLQAVGGCFREIPFCRRRNVRAEVIGEANSDRIVRALEKVPVKGSEVLAGDFRTRLGSVGIR
jgi:hypothetical protein